MSPLWALSYIVLCVCVWVCFVFPLLFHSVIGNIGIKWKTVDMMNQVRWWLLSFVTYSIGRKRCDPIRTMLRFISTLIGKSLLPSLGRCHVMATTWYLKMSQKRLAPKMSNAAMRDSENHTKSSHVSPTTHLLSN